MTWATQAAAADAAVFSAFADTEVTVDSSTFNVLLDRDVRLRNEYGEVVERVTFITSRRSDAVLTVGTVLVGSTEQYTVARIEADDNALQRTIVTVAAVASADFDFHDATAFNFHDGTGFDFHG